MTRNRCACHIGKRNSFHVKQTGSLCRFSQELLSEKNISLENKTSGETGSVFGTYELRTTSDVLVDF